MMQGQFHLLSPYWLLALPLLWLYLYRWQMARQRHSPSGQPCIADMDSATQQVIYHPLVDAYLARQHAHTAQPQPARFALWWQGTALSLLLLALTQPVLTGERLPDPPPQRDIVFLVDTSVSMQLMDYELEGQPVRRMALLQQLLERFARTMQGERISVIIFAETAYLWIPLTHDQYLLRRMLKRITTTLAGRDSALGEALLMALKEASKTPQRHQTFILFTDAQSAQGKVSATAAAELVAERGIPVFTVAIGSSQSQPDKAVQGGLYQAVNLDLLAEIARMTGGKSYQVHDSHAMQQALQAILQQRQNLAQPRPRYAQYRLHFYPLLAGLLMLLLYPLWRWQYLWRTAHA